MYAAVDVASLFPIYSRLWPLLTGREGAAVAEAEVEQICARYSEYFRTQPSRVFNEFERHGVSSLPPLCLLFPLHKVVDKNVSQGAVFGQ